MYLTNTKTTTLYSVSSCKYNPNPKYNYILAYNEGNKLHIAETTNTTYTKSTMNFPNTTNSPNTNTFNILSSFENNISDINYIKFNKQGNILCTAGNDSMLNIYDLERMSLNRSILIEDPISNITCCDINTENNLVLCGIYDKLILLYDIRMKKHAYRLMAHSEPITDIAFMDSTDSKNNHNHNNQITENNNHYTFLSISYDGFIRIWDLFKGNCIKSMSLEKSPPLSQIKILNNNGGNYALISSLNSQITLVDLDNEAEKAKYIGHKNEEYLLKFDYFISNEEEPILVSGSEDGFLYYWNLWNSNMVNSSINKISTQSKLLSSISINSSADYIACVDADSDSLKISQMKY